MKKIVSVLIAIIMVFGTLTCCFANNEYEQKIEQVYANMPEITAFVKAESQPTANNIIGYMNNDQLAFESCLPYNREDGVSFIFMVDCSTSVSSGQMSSIKRTIFNFIKNDAQANDKFVIVSFGQSVDVLADAENTKDEVLGAVNSLKNNQQATVLYDAVSKARQIAGGMNDSYPKKRMCVVFTDAVDYTVGGTTREELMESAEMAGIPLYVVAINEYNKESIDVLGQVARRSGGEMFVATGGNIGSAFNKSLAELNSIYAVKFKANSNKINAEKNNLRVWLTGNQADACVEQKFGLSSWKSDNVPPQIIDAELISSKEIKITFSEPVANADVKENYTVKKGIANFAVADVLYDATTATAILTFEYKVGSGSYSITAANIVDDTMEKNALTSEYSFKISGFKATMINVENFFKRFWWAILLLNAIAVAVIMLIIIKKRKGIVMVEGKATFADNISYEKTPAKPLPSKYLQIIMETPDGSVTNLDINIVQSIIFGRAKTCEVTINDDSLSRQHFVIELEDDMLFVQNLSETNGTLLNGVLLQAKRKLMLGDVISAGQERFTINKI
ncbi:MAG: VWA domain-containing protein [Clostridia bacterium]|nr:VWA domain-containing protein [Clostridia bacterium]